MLTGCTNNVAELVKKKKAAHRKWLVSKKMGDVTVGYLLNKDVKNKVKGQTIQVLDRGD